MSQPEHSEASTADSIDARKWLVLGAVGSGIFLSTLSGSIINVALPTLSREFNADFAAVQWVILAFLVTTAALLIPMGRLGDIIGKKPVYVSGLVIFTIASVLCALAPSLGWLVAFRMVQAVGAAMTQALGLAIATEAFPPSQRGLAVGYAGGLVSLGVVAGPTLGGALVALTSWRWIFAVNIPIGIIAVGLVLLLVPNNRPARHTPFDIAGAVLLLVALTAPLLALTQGQADGFGEPLVLVLLGVGVTASALFLRTEARSPHPLAQLELFSNTTFRAGLVSGLFAFTALGGVLLLLPFYLEDMLGYSAIDVGLLIGLVPILLGVLAPLSGAASDRWGTTPFSLAGLVTMGSGLLLMSQLSLDTSTSGFVVLVVPYAVGLGLFQSPNNSAILGAVPPETLGTASGLLSVTRNLGSTIGTAAAGAIWSAGIAARSSEDAARATEAPLATQVASLRDTVIILGVSLLIPTVVTLVSRPGREQTGATARLPPRS